MTTGRETAESADHRGARRRAPSIIASRRRALTALALVGAVVIVGLAAYIWRASSVIPAAASVRVASPARLLATNRPAFPLRVGLTGRYLVDRDGRAFLIVGDSPQALVVNLSESQADHFFADREAAGFKLDVDQPAVRRLHRGPSRGHHVRRHRSVPQARRPLHPKPCLLRPRGRYDPPRRQAQTRGISRSHRDRRLAQASCDATALPRPTPTVATSGCATGGISNIVWLNGNDFQTWQQPAGRCAGAGGRQGHQVRRSARSCRPSSSTILTSTSLDDPRWSGHRRARRRLHVRPDVCGGPQSVSLAANAPARIHDRGQLRG